MLKLTHWHWGEERWGIKSALWWTADHLVWWKLAHFIGICTSPFTWLASFLVLLLFATGHSCCHSSLPHGFLQPLMTWWTLIGWEIRVSTSSFSVPSAYSSMMEDYVVGAVWTVVTSEECELFFLFSINSVTEALSQWPPPNQHIQKFTTGGLLSNLIQDKSSIPKNCLKNV